VLATGLSALYSSLPRKIEVRGDDWHALRREDWMSVSSLVLFMNSLEFCNAVVQVAHPLVRSQLLDYLHNGFLVPVMGPALHKVRGGGRKNRSVWPDTIQDMWGNVCIRLGGYSQTDHVSL